MNYLHTPTLTPTTLGTVRDRRLRVLLTNGADLSDGQHLYMAVRKDI